MQIQSEWIAEDCSGYTCVIQYKCIIFVISYIDNKLVVRLAPYKRKPSHPAWYLSHIQKWAEQRMLEVLPENFIQAHKELYAS